MPWIILIVVIALWVLAENKTSRPDGEFIKRTPAYRRMLAIISPGINDSTVYFDRGVEADKLEAYLAKAKAFDANLTHLLVAAFGIGLGENPRMNQFVRGFRLYRRKGRWITFSMKRKKLDRKAKVSARKIKLEDGETFRELVERINAGIGEERSGKKTAADKEFDLLNALPRPLLYAGERLLQWLDYYNLLPAAFIHGDAMYTSIFIANLGSLGMGAGYHHLYNWGTCPLFIMVGRTEERVVVEDGKPVIKRILPLRFTYDERIDDGLNAHHGIESVVRVIEDPERWLGCLAEDGSDARSMFPHDDEVVSPIADLTGTKKIQDVE